LEFYKVADRVLRGKRLGENTHQHHLVWMRTDNLNMRTWL
jgi:hypothetical protein